MPILNVDITYQDGYYMAECNVIHLVTEAKSLNELKKMVWDLVPDLIDLNELDIDVNSVELVFSM